MWKIILWNISGLTLMQGSVNAELTEKFLDLGDNGYGYCEANRKVKCIKNWLYG